MIENPTEIFTEHKPSENFAPDVRSLLRYQADTELKDLRSMRPAGDSAEWVNPLDKQFRLTQGFGNFNPNLYAGKTAGSRHMGVDVATPSGTPVKSPVSGKVSVGYDPKGFGTYVRVTDKNGMTYQFSHLSKADQLPQEVQAGQEIGLSGGTPGTYGAGNTTGAHLDISAMQNGRFIDPITIQPLRRALQG